MNEPATLPEFPSPATPDEKTLAIVMHLFCLIGMPVIGPLVIWLMKKDQSPYLDAQGRELLNFQISYMIYIFIAAMLLFVLVGIVVLPIVGFIAAVLIVIGIVRATEGKVYRFPFTIRFL
ncbi:MAG: hypothetical protein JWO94_1676 [Verrucomicrobiaceae bacterium]|nr:hypothetical protein [Verrucomicrobiaceae bacterium]